MIQPLPLLDAKKCVALFTNLHSRTLSDTELMDEQYSLYGVKLPGGGAMGPMGPGPRGPPAAARAPFPAPAGPPYDVTRYDLRFLSFSASLLH